MDPYIVVCRDREFDYEKILFENFFFLSENEQKIEHQKTEYQKTEYQKSIPILEKISNFAAHRYKLPNVLFESYDNIVLCNIDIIFRLAGIKYDSVIKRYENQFSFCELNGNSMSEYFLWRLYNSRGYGIFYEGQSSLLTNKNYSAILPPVKTPELNKEEIIVEDKDYFIDELLQRSAGGVDLFIVNESTPINEFIIKRCIKKGGNCVIAMRQKSDELINVIKYFRKLALIKPLSSDKVYLILLDKTDSENSFDDDKFEIYLNNYFPNNYLGNNYLENKKETLYYLNRANTYFCIY